MTPAWKRGARLPGSALPRGFRFAATACGLKKNGRPDLVILSSDAPATAAGAFTTNLVQAAPVVLSREHLRRAARAVRAIVVNSGNANCATGPVGMAAAQTTATAVARELGGRAEQVLVCSTGVIGVPLRVERILRALPRLVRAQRPTPGAFVSVTRAIMTTDTPPQVGRCLLPHRWAARAPAGLRQRRGHDSPADGHDALVCAHRRRCLSGRAPARAARDHLAHVQLHHH